MKTGKSLRPTGRRGRARSDAGGLIEAVREAPPAPCDGCNSRLVCEAGAACLAFAQYVIRGSWDEAEVGSPSDLMHAALDSDYVDREQHVLRRVEVLRRSRQRALEDAS